MEALNLCECEVAVQRMAYVAKRVYAEWGGVCWDEIGVKVHFLSLSDPLDLWMKGNSKRRPLLLANLSLGPG